MFSRKDYLDGKCTHRQFYAQMVTDDTKRWVISNIGENRLLQSVDEHLNDIPLGNWDSYFYSQSFTESKRLLYKHGDNCANSLSNAVCVAKEAARQVLDEIAAKSTSKVSS